MSDIWTSLGPWLMMAVALPAAVVASLWLMVTDEWAGRVIGDWAEARGLRVVDIEDARVGCYPTSSLSRAYRVRLRDARVAEVRCRAVVGRLVLGGDGPNLAISWTPPR